MATVHEKMTALANEIRALSGTANIMGLDAMKTHISNANSDINTEAGLITQIQTVLQGKIVNNATSLLQNNITNLQNILESVNNLPEGGGESGPTPSQVSRKDVNFYNHDGTLLYSYTLAEVQSLTALPELPTANGLTCQGWNWSLADIKNRTVGVDVGAIYTTDDGTTRIYITLHEGRTAPMLGFCPNGTVTIDWGDGSTSTLTGTSTSTLKWTPNHQYPAPGDYVIKLTVNGTMGFGGNDSNEYCYLLRHNSSSDYVNIAYQNAIKKIEIGNGISSFAYNSFHQCQSLMSVTIPNTVTRIAFGAFNTCYSLPFLVVPNSVTTIEYYGFINCQSLKSISLPNTITSIDSGAYYGCQMLDFISIPTSVKNIYPYAFSYCGALTSLTIPEGVTLIDSYAFNDCYSLASVYFPKSLTQIGSEAFSNCCAVKIYDFSKHTKVPTLSAASAFNGIASDCEIRVPSSLLNSWKSATNWSSFSNNIVSA